MGRISITKRKNKSGIVWQYRFEIGSIDGKRQWESKSGFFSKKEAVEAGKKAQQIYENTGRLIKHSEITYSDFLDYWMETDIKTTCKPTTMDNYQKKIRLYIKPDLGKYRIKTITKQNIKDFLTKMYNNGFSVNTISVCKSILTKSFDYAAENNYIIESPAQNIKMPTQSGLPPTTPTRLEPHIYIPADKMSEILNSFPEGSSCHLALMLGYHCGLRLGETFGLTWEDIDLEKKYLSVNRQIQWMPNNHNDSKSANETSLKGYWYLCEPKYRSYRTITIDDSLAELLQREKDRIDLNKQCNPCYTKYYVNQPLIYGGVKPTVPPPFTKISDQGKTEVHFIHVRPNGALITPQTLKYTSSVIHHKLNFPEFDFHSLRHTHSTMLLEQGAPLVYIQRRLGHANIDVTANIYTNHLTESMKNQGNSIVNHLFKSN